MRFTLVLLLLPILVFTQIANFEGNNQIFSFPAEFEWVNRMDENVVSATADSPDDAAQPVGGIFVRSSMTPEAVGILLFQQQTGPTDIRTNFVEISSLPRNNQSFPYAAVGVSPDIMDSNAGTSFYFCGMGFDNMNSVPALSFHRINVNDLALSGGQPPAGIFPFLDGTPRSALAIDSMGPPGLILATDFEIIFCDFGMGPPGPPPPGPPPPPMPPMCTVVASWANISTPFVPRSVSGQMSIISGRSMSIGPNFVILYFANDGSGRLFHGTYEPPTNQFMVQSEIELSNCGVSQSVGPNDSFSAFILNTFGDSDSDWRIVYSLTTPDGFQTGSFTYSIDTHECSQNEALVSAGDASSSFSSVALSPDIALTGSYSASDNANVVCASTFETSDCTFGFSGVADQRVVLSRVSQYESTTPASILTYFDDQRYFVSVTYSENNESEGNNDTTTTTVAIVVAVVGCCLFSCIILLLIAGGVLYAKKKSRHHDSQLVVEMDSTSNKSEKLLREHLITGDVVIKKEIGKGVGGSVFLAKWRGEKVALKKLNSDNLQDFVNEANLLKQLQSPNVVRFWGISKIDEDLFIVLEFVKNGSLLDVIRSNPDLTPQQLFYTTYSSLKGMQYLESKKVIHRDLACRNILCSYEAPNYQCKITDFGLSREASYEIYSVKTQRPIPVRWTAPEIFEQHPFSHKSDVWAYGVTCWEIFQHGLAPYSGMNNQEVIDYVRKGKRLSKPEKCPKKMFRLIKRCWRSDPDDRETFEQLLPRVQKIGVSLGYNEYGSDSDSDISSLASPSSNAYSKGSRATLTDQNSNSEKNYMARSSSSLPYQKVEELSNRDTEVLSQQENEYTMTPAAPSLISSKPSHSHSASSSSSSERPSND